MEKTFDGEHVPSLKIFQFCGEELPRKTAEELLRRFPHAKVFNTYGPTEATVAMTQIEVTEEVLSKYDRVPIGYIKEDTEVLIYDGNRAVTDGIAGEIIIKGPSVSKGYMHNPEKTAAAFSRSMAFLLIVQEMLEDFRRMGYCYMKDGLIFK